MKTSRLFAFASLALAATLSLNAAHAAYTEKILYTLMGSSDGGNPTGLLTADAKGNLYGVAAVGGNTNCQVGMENTDGCGVVFELTPTTQSQVVLHTFNFTGVSGSDGASPVGGVIRDTAGTLFGATAQ